MSAGQDDQGSPGSGHDGAPHDQPLRGRRILLVEDEAMLAIELQFALEDAGAQVVGPALTLAEATADLEGDGPFDGAVLDVNLAGQSVVPLAQSLAQAGVPILFNTGHADRGELLAKFPAAEVLSKPNRGSVLAARLAALIARARPN